MTKIYSRFSWIWVKTLLTFQTLKKKNIFFIATTKRLVSLCCRNREKLWLLWMVNLPFCLFFCMLFLFFGCCCRRQNLKKTLSFPEFLSLLTKTARRSSFLCSSRKLRRGQIMTIGRRKKIHLPVPNLYFPPMSQWRQRALHRTPKERRKTMMPGYYV